MSIRFAAETDGLIETGDVVVGEGSSPYTVTWWAMIVVDRAAISTMWDSSRDTQAGTNYLQVATAADGTTMTVEQSSAGATLTGPSMVVGTWYKFGLVRTAVSGTTTLYYAALGDALTTVSGAASTAHTPNQLRLAYSLTAGEWFNGRLAAFKHWHNVALTANEVALELAQFDPVRLTNLTRYHPFHVAEVTDYSGNGYSLAAGTTAATTEDDPPIGGPPLQPSYVADRGTTADATAATTSTVALASPTSIATGNYLIARVAVDNSGTNGAAPGCTVTDPRSNTWTVLGPALVDPGAAAAGAAAYLCYTKVGTAYQAADALTFNWGGVSTTAKAIVVEEWANIHRTSPAAVSAVTNNAAASTAVTVSITPTAPNQLVYTCLATEGIAADTFTGDADTTNGTWATLTTTASANATATNNQRVMGQYKKVSAAGAQSWDATITNRDWAALAVVFAPDEIRPTPRVINQAALVRASSW